jgi:hypothetical protein
MIPSSLSGANTNHLLLTPLHCRTASAEAAVAAAAHRVLSRLLPFQEAGIIGPAYAASLATIADGPSKTAGIALGEQVADALFVQRASHGYQNPVAYVVPSPLVAGAWVPTAASPPIGPYLGHVRPFSLDTASQFRPAGPPSLTGERWARDFDEVKRLGARTGSTRSAEMTLAARFWAEAPVEQARGAFRKFVQDRGLDVLSAARFMAMVSVTYADALIACFDAKYSYAFWRPVTAIPAGDRDGNAETAGDESWLPLLPGTPNHPEYPSAHSCITPAGALALAGFLGTDQINFTIPSLISLGDRYYARVQDLAHEVGEARIWGGIHYRASVDDGREIARKTADYVLSHHFRRLAH